MANPNDIFGSGGGGGNFPKIDELENKLVLLIPSVAEEVPKPKEFGGKPGETQTRITADTIVFSDDSDEPEVYDDMYFSQVGIVNPCKRQLKPGAKGKVLGRVTKVPSKIGKDQGFDTTEKILKGLEEHFASNGKKPKPNFSWGLEPFSDEDGRKAMSYLAKRDLGSGADD